MPQFTLILHKSQPRHDRSEQDARRFFLRFGAEVEILTSASSLGQKMKRLCACVKQAQGQIIFILDPDLSIPLVEVLTWATQLTDDPKIEALFANRLTARKRPGVPEKASSKLELDPLAKKLMAQVQKNLGPQSLPDPLCDFFAFRSTLKPAWERTFSSRVLTAQDFALRVPLPARGVAEVQWTSRPQPLSLVNFIRGHWELRTLTASNPS